MEKLSKKYPLLKFFHPANWFQIMPLSWCISAYLLSPRHEKVNPCLSQTDTIGGHYHQALGKMVLPLCKGGLCLTPWVVIHNAHNRQGAYC